MDAFDIFKNIEGKQISIVESKTYFEAYYHVLHCL